MSDKYKVNELEIESILDAIKIRYGVELVNYRKIYFRNGICKLIGKTNLLILWSKIMKHREYIDVCILYGQNKYIGGIYGRGFEYSLKLNIKYLKRIKWLCKFFKLLCIKKTYKSITMVKTLEIKGSNNTPHILLNPYRNKFKIQGKSSPDKCNEFYLPVVEWIRSYADNPNSRTDFYFRVDDFDICSAKNFLLILNILKNARNNSILNIYWEYCDDDSYDIGKNYQNIIKIPFNFIKK